MSSFDPRFVSISHNRAVVAKNQHNRQGEPLLADGSGDGSLLLVQHMTDARSSHSSKVWR